MTRIDKKFKELKKKRKKAFIVYITAGDPSLSTTEKLALELEKSGVDILELGVPFSDPMADGPTIQRASGRALKKKTNLASILTLVKKIRKKSDIPIALMSYFNPIFNYGTKDFVKRARASGVDGVIIPDLPPEEASELLKEAGKNDFNCIFLLAPTSTAKRIKIVSKKSSGFIYYVSLTGVTGARNTLPSQVVSDVRKIKRSAGKPVCVGFGISTPKQIRAIASVSDGVILGSAVIKVIEKNLSKPGLVRKTANFVKRMAGALE